MQKLAHPTDNHNRKSNTNQYVNGRTDTPTHAGEYATAVYSLSEVLSGTSFILAESGSPPSRDFIDAVIGAANDTAEWFECPDAELVRYMWTDRNITVVSKKKKLPHGGKTSWRGSPNPATRH